MSFDSFFNSNPNLKLKVLRDLVSKYKGYLPGAEIDNDIAIFGDPETRKVFDEIKAIPEFSQLQAQLQEKDRRLDTQKEIVEKFLGNMYGSYSVYDLLSTRSVYADLKGDDAVNQTFIFGGLGEALTVLFEPLERVNFPDSILRGTKPSQAPNDQTTTIDSIEFSMRDMTRVKVLDKEDELTAMRFKTLTAAEKQAVVRLFSEEQELTSTYITTPTKLDNPKDNPGKTSDEVNSQKQNGDVELFRLRGDANNDYQRRSGKWYTRKKGSAQWGSNPVNATATNRLETAYADESKKSEKTEDSKAATSNQETKSESKEKPALDAAAVELLLLEKPQPMPYFLNRLKESSDPGVNNNITSPTKHSPNLSAMVIRKPIFNKGSRNDNFLSVFFGAVSQLELSRCTPFLSLTFFNKREAKQAQKTSLDNAAYMRLNFKQDDAGNFVASDFSQNKPEAVPDFLFDSQELNSTGYMDIFTSPQTMVNANINKVGNQNTFNFQKNKFNRKELDNVLDPFAPMLSLKTFNSTINGAGNFMITNRRAKLSVVLHDRSRMEEIAPLISLNRLGQTVVKIEHGWSHPDGDPVKSNNDIGKFLNSMRETHIYQLTSSDFSINGNEVTINIVLDFYGASDFRDTSVALGTKSKLDKLQKKILVVIDDMIKRKKIGSVRNGQPALSSVTEYSEKEDGDSDSPSIPSVLKNLKILRNSVTTEAFLVNTTLKQELEVEIEEIIINRKKGSPIETFNHARIISKFINLIGASDIGEDATTDDILEVLSNENLLNSFLENNKTNLIGRLLEKIESAVGHQSEFTFMLDEKKNQIPVEIRTPITPDHFIGGQSYAYTTPAPDYTYPDNHVSLGKLICNLIALPLAATNENYTEVQVMFYPINRRAAGARKYTTASLPVNISALKSFIYKAIKSDYDLTARGMFDLLANYFQNNELEAYELTSFSKEAIKEIEKKIKEEKDFEKKAFARFKKLSKRDPKDDKEKETAKSSYLKKRIKEKKSTSLTKDLERIYENDGMGPGPSNTFRKPQLHLELESVPQIVPPRGDDEPLSLGQIKSILNTPGSVSEEDKLKIEGVDNSKRILRIHVFDENATPRPFETMMMDGLVSAESFAPIAGQLREFASNKDFKASDAFKQRITSFQGKLQKYISAMPYQELKQYLMRSFPTIRYGSQHAVVKQINISSNTNDEIVNARLNNTIFKNENREQGVVEGGSTRQNEFQEFVLPTSVDLQIYGCPFITMGQNVYLDLGTGTDIDNVYMVGDVSHTISAGDYTTSISLFLPQVGSSRSIRSDFVQALKLIDAEQFEKDMAAAAAKESAANTAAAREKNTEDLKRHRKNFPKPAGSPSPFSS